MKKNANKKITLEKLADLMAKGFAQISKNFEQVNKDMDSGFVQEKKDNEDLATMVQQSFNEVNSRLTLLERSKQETNDRLSVMGRNQEEIKLRLTNVAYRFELDELQNKVQKVEDIVLRKKR